MKKYVGLFFCMGTFLSVCAMDQTVQEDVLISFLYKPEIANFIVEYSSLQDALRLFFVDSNYYDGFFKPIEKVYKDRVPQELRDGARDFNAFVKMFCTCNDWIHNREISSIVRKKLLPFYVQYHCQEYHIPVLERLGMAVEEDENEPGVKIFRQAHTNDFLFKRSQKDIFDQEKLDNLHVDFVKALNVKDLIGCFKALMNGADVNFYSESLVADEHVTVNALCKMFTRRTYDDNKEREIIFLLLYCGATASSNDTLSYLPLSLAARKDDVELVQLLLKNGVSPTIADTHGATPLHWLCISSVYVDNYYQKLVIAKLLLEHGADIYAQNEDGLDSHMYLLSKPPSRFTDQDALWALIRYFVDCKSLLEGHPFQFRGFAEFPLPERLVRY